MATASGRLCSPELLFPEILYPDQPLSHKKLPLPMVCITDYYHKCYRSVVCSAYKNNLGISLCIRRSTIVTLPFDGLNEIQVMAPRQSVILYGQYSKRILSKRMCT